MNFLFVCSGTAGHINPALAVATELRTRIPDSEILFVGADRVLEKKLIPQSGFKVVNIKMSGLRRGFSPGDIIYNLNTAKNILTASRESSKLIKSFKPDIAIGTGGYICYPVLRKAAKLGIPTLIHDSNAVPGLTTKLLSGVVDKVLVSFPNQEKLYKKPERVVFTGTPIRKDFISASDNKSPRTENDRPLVVSFWGSLGAERMNEVIAEVIMLNIKHREFDHIHAVGEKDGVLEIKNILKQKGVKGVDTLPAGIQVIKYIDDMPALMTAADLIICRGGGSTVAELMEMSKPAIIIPSPYVANNEQEYNAQQLRKAGGAILLKEKVCTGKKLYEEVTSLLSDKNLLASMSESLKQLTAPNATTNVVDLVLAMTHG